MEPAPLSACLGVGRKEYTFWVLLSSRETPAPTPLGRALLARARAFPLETLTKTFLSNAPTNLNVGHREELPHSYPLPRRRRRAPPSPISTSESLADSRPPPAPLSRPPVVLDPRWGDGLHHWHHLQNSWHPTQRKYYGTITLGPLFTLITTLLLKISRGYLLFLCWFG